MANNFYSEISDGRLYQKVVSHIEKQILDGDLKVGDKLPSEQKLGKQFGVSRTSIREAIRMLVFKGLVEINLGRGTFVTTKTSLVVRDSLSLLIQIEKKESFRNLIEIREILEPEIASIAAVRATEEDITALREAIMLMDESLGDSQKYIEADLDFHLALAEANQNPLMLILLDLLIGQLREQRFWAASVDDSMVRSQIHHKNVLAAVENRIPDAARDAMLSHLKQVHQDIQIAVSLGKFEIMDL